MNEDNTFNHVAAENWKKEVDGEIVRVKDTLAQVAEVCATKPYEDDYIMNLMYQTGQGLIEAWNGLISAFQQAIESMLAISKEFYDWAKKIGDSIVEFAENFKLGS